MLVREGELNWGRGQGVGGRRRRLGDCVEGH